VRLIGADELDAISRAKLERKKASDFPQGLLDLLDSYVHGAIGRREFLVITNPEAIASVLRDLVSGRSPWGYGPEYFLVG